MSCPVCHSEDVELVDVETNQDPVDTVWESQYFCNECESTFIVFEKVVFDRVEIIDKGKTCEEGEEE